MLLLSISFVINISIFSLLIYLYFHLIKGHNVIFNNLHFYTWKKEKTIQDNNKMQVFSVFFFPIIEMQVVKNGSISFNQVKKINKERENASINYE